MNKFEIDHVIKKNRKKYPLQTAMWSNMTLGINLSFDVARSVVNTGERFLITQRPQETRFQIKRWLYRRHGWSIFSLSCLCVSLCGGLEGFYPWYPTGKNLIFPISCDGLVWNIRMIAIMKNCLESPDFGKCAPSPCILLSVWQEKGSELFFIEMKVRIGLEICEKQWRTAVYNVWSSV